MEDRLPFGMWPPIRYRLGGQAALTLAYGLAGDRANAMAQLKVLEEFRIGFLGSAILNPLKANAIARAHMALGDYASVARDLNRDEGGWTKTVWYLNNAAWGFSGDDASQTFVVLPKLLMRGISSYETGDRATAKAALSAILRHNRISDFGELRWLALYYWGLISERESDLRGATDAYAKAVSVIEQQRATINTEASKIGFVGDKQAVYGRLIALLAQQGRAGEAFDYVERSKSRALVDLLASKKDFIAAGADAEKVRRVLAQLDAADLASRAQDDGAKPGESAGVRSFELARREIGQTAPELSTLVTVGSIAPDELKGLIGEREALVEYYHQGDDLYAFVVTRAQLQAVKLDAKGLGERVRAFRRAIEDPGSSFWDARARALYEQLWQPIEALVTAGSVVVVPHGALHYLPFAALRRADGSLLIDQYALRFLPSASVLKFLRPALAKQAGELLALGNPDLDDPKLDLRFAEGEAKSVAGMFPSSRVLVRKDASETNFRKAGGVFSRIHFATHGKFQADDPLNSGLQLAKDGENDGVLTVGELYSINLDADLVTLSACETGLGRIANGDDVVGLTRGFLYAGSRSIVASLWSVDDQATATLMKTFYENLAAHSKQDALRQAQIKTRLIYPHPFYWAAFQLTGRAE
ncbi:MAG: CHAT domain-containing protein [Acidobacteria bacterium]|nr:CHAT domain-containing protein [Acidobacteriota bacterium]